MVNGIRWALFSVVTAAAGALFGLLLDWLTFPTNYQAVFILSFIAGLLTCYTFSRLRLPGGQPPPEPARARLRLFDLVQQVRQEPAFARFLLSTFIYRLGLNLPVPLFSIYWVNVMQASDTLIGLRTTVAYAALILSYLLWGWLAARRGPRLVLLLSSLGVSFYPLLTAASPDIVWLMPVALLWGLFVSGIDISFFETLLRTIPRQRQALFIAVNSALANLAIFVSPLAGAALADLIGLVPSLVLAGLLSLLGTLLMGVLAVAGRPATAQPATGQEV
jgi:MFS family permease